MVGYHQILHSLIGLWHPFTIPSVSAPPLFLIQHLQCQGTVLWPFIKRETPQVVLSKNIFSLIHTLQGKYFPNTFAETSSSYLHCWWLAVYSPLPVCFCLGPWIRRVTHHTLSLQFNFPRLIISYGIALACTQCHPASHPGIMDSGLPPFWRGLGQLPKRWFLPAKNTRSFIVTHGFFSLL